MSAPDSILARSIFRWLKPAAAWVLMAAVVGWPLASQEIRQELGSAYAVVAQAAVEATRVELVLEVAGLRHGWLEVSSFTDPDLPTRLWLLEPAANAESMTLDLPSAFHNQLLMVCRAAEVGKGVASGDGGADRSDIDADGAGADKVVAAKAVSAEAVSAEAVSAKAVSAEAVSAKAVSTEAVSPKPDSDSTASLGAGSARSGLEVRGVYCDQLFVEAGDLVGLSWAEGAAVTGTYLFESRPSAGVRVAVVPTGLNTLRPFTMPLAAAEETLRREVTTSADGRFRLPPLGPGQYRLEALLPSGRVHRSDPFELVSALSLRAELGVGAEVAVARDLGPIYVEDALAAEVLARDSEGELLAAVRVEARQGRRVSDLRTFEGETDAEGYLRLSGFELDLPTHLTCRREGYLPLEQEFDQIPARVECVLGRPAAVRGTVLDAEGLPLTGATVRLADGDTLPLTASTSGLSAGDGGFELAGLPAGEKWLWLSAAGHEVERLPVSLRVGETTEAGEQRLLLAGDLQGMVRAATSGEPLAGIEVRVIEPAAGFVLSDIDGEFSLPAPRLAGALLQVAGEGWATLNVELDPEAFFADEPVVFELDRAGWLGVSVESGAGQPCRGCRVEIAPLGEQLLTDPEGLALSSPLAAGEYRVYLPRVDHLGSVVVEQRYAKGARVKVKAGELTTLRLSLEQQPVEVRLTPAPVPAPGEAAWMLGARRGSRFERRHPRPDGSYELDARTGQVLDLALLAVEPTTGAESEIQIGQLRIEDGQERALIELSSSHIEGRVEIDGAPAVGKTVWLISLLDLQPRARVGVAADGSFHIPHALPGIYSLRVGSRTVDIVRVPIRGRLKLSTYRLPSYD